MRAEQLRKSILQYAIQGKLVPQIDTEEPASELLKKIKAEKQELIKQDKIKKEKPLPPITDEEKPFDIPESWEWVRFSDIVSFNLGKTPDRKNSQFWNNGQYNWVSIADLKDKETIYQTKEKVSQKAYDEQFSNGLSKTGTLLMSFKLTIGKVSILGCDAFHNEAIVSIYPFINIDDIIKMYLFHTLCLIVNYADSTDAIKGSTLNSTKMKTMLVPLPPIAEQQRIVARIDELMAFVDEYEKKEIELSKLEKEFPEKLKKSILQYAIQGKLVQQIDTEEPASELLKKIKAEKQELIRQGKIKKQKDLPPITDEEKPFEIPDSWEWVRLGSTLNIARGGSPRPIQSYITEAEDGVNWIKIGDTEKGSKYINSTKQKIIKSGMSKSRFVTRGDFLLSNSMSFGRPYILNVDGCIHDGWLVLSDFAKVYFQDYLFYLLSSNFIYQQFSGIVSGAVVNNLNSDKASITVISLPPFTEQQRIVARIEELFTLVDILAEGKKLPKVTAITENKDNVIPFVTVENDETKHRVDVSSFEMAARDSDSVNPETMEKVLKQVQAYYDKKN